jgi:hypothetical protein
MTFVTFSKADAPAEFIDVFLYDMTTPLGAFGVYSVERPSGSKAIATDDGGHRTGAHLFFRKGQYYASILTSGPDEDVRPATADSGPVPYRQAARYRRALMLGKKK